MPTRVQGAGFVLVLSPDWLIQRASDNARSFFGTYPQRMIGEPLSDFTMAQPLHDLRNSLARQQSASGIARVYRVRLVQEQRFFDIVYQQVGGRIVLEGMDCSDDSNNAGLGAVSRLIEGLDGNRNSVMEQAARRMRALTGFDRVMLSMEGTDVTSSRSPYPPLDGGSDDLPPLLIDAAEASVGLFPAAQAGGSALHALLRAPSDERLAALRAQGIHAAMNIPVRVDGQEVGRFRCDNRALVRPNFELHGAAELFSQVFAMCWSRAQR
jgi:light-regulated signal transduction histidine kinase (bacteriophytochrome)